MRRTELLVVAKSPRPGRVKTRLCPPLSHPEAALVAEAALADTLQAVVRCGVGRRLLALDGPPGAWLPSGFDVFAQGQGSLDRRLAAAWERLEGPCLQIGMDTPQVTADILDRGLERLTTGSASSVLGPALDGGWWCLGMVRPDPSVFAGVTMSTSTTGRHQFDRLRQLGHVPELLMPLRDVDDIEDAEAVAAEVPGSRFAEVLRRCTSSREVGAEVVGEETAEARAG